MIRTTVTIGLLVAAVLYLYWLGAFDLPITIARWWIGGHGGRWRRCAALNASIVLSMVLLSFPCYDTNAKGENHGQASDGQMPQMWILDVDIGWRSRCHGSLDFHVQRSGGPGIITGSERLRVGMEGIGGSVPLPPWERLGFGTDFIE
jgi:hypothetical protein